MEQLRRKYKSTAFAHWFLPDKPKPLDLKRHPLVLPCAVATDQPNDERLSCLGLPLSLPYEVESLDDMDARLEVIVTRLTECVKAREWSIGFRMWTSALNM